MKKLFRSLALVVAAALMMTACGGGGGGATPLDVVKKYTEATQDFDFAKAKQYVSKDYLEAFNESIAMFESPEMQPYLEIAKTAAKEAKVEFGEAKIDGDNATVSVKTSTMGQEIESVITLVKEDGQWKINGAGM